MTPIAKAPTSREEHILDPALALPVDSDYLAR
jgi:hypothetical protein